ncbi:MAG TPA: tetratricopeptide repeat protein [Patescibacteria group bacterium]|nr:tetratricopeptide repeat protein [Patescibacteria group bacterium]
MPRIDYPDSHYLLHAIGWLELGNLSEAKAELGHLKAELQAHPNVLEVRWAISAEAKEWQEGLEVARKLVEVAPERASGWLHRAYALRRVAGGGLEQAWQALLPASEKFPDIEMIAYNLSCYACQMSQLDVARGWLKRACALADKKQILERALQDEDLKPLWNEIQQL